MTSTQSEKIFFRLNPIVAAQLKARAQSLGFTVSEFVRLSIFSALGIKVPGDVKGMKEKTKEVED